MTLVTSQIMTKNGAIITTSNNIGKTAPLAEITSRIGIRTGVWSLSCSQVLVIINQIDVGMKQIRYLQIEFHHDTCEVKRV